MLGKVVAIDSEFRTMLTNSLSTRSLQLQGHRPLIYILLTLAIVYFPFADKAFNVDDTLFLKAAEQILVAPFDFYGGELNWYGSPESQHTVIKNPPLVSYLIAIVSSVFGFSEVVLHSFFFLPLALSAIGIYQLGRQYDTNPVFTTILAIFTPVFLVHGTNLMSDSTMLNFWIWGLVFWNIGLRTNFSKWFVLAGISVTLGILTKYTCVLLLPLMVFSGVWKYKKPGLWLLAVFIPVVAMIGFEVYTQTLYGKGLFREAFVYANDRAPKDVVDYFDNTLIGLSFLGGCFPVALFLMPVIGGRVLNLGVLISAVACLALVFYRGGVGSHLFSSDGVNNAALIIQFCTFSLVGICVVMACAKEVSKGLNHDSIFLLLWFFGIFVFGCYLNWAINARSFILLVPVVGILLSRRLGEWNIKRGSLKNTTVYATIGVAGLISVATVYADYAWANTARTAAREITLKYGEQGRIFFQGHWGFQFYMEKLGARPLNYLGPNIRLGDYIVVPINNTNLAKLDSRFNPVEIMTFSPKSFIATMSPARSAGFYASVWGAVPYSFEKPREELYYIYMIK